MGFFEAHVQYGDWKGTAAADNADETSLREYLQENSHMQDSDYLLATHIWIGENSHGRLENVFVHAYILEGYGDYESVKKYLEKLGDEPIPVRDVRLTFTLEQYIGLFKRFSVMLTTRAFDLKGREFQS